MVTCRPILTCLPPQRLGGIVDDGGGVLPTRCPPFNFIYPPSVGGFFPASLTTTGAACGLHTAPFYFFFLLPLLGGASFPWATRWRVTHMPPPFHPPPSFRRGLLIHPPSIGGILSNNDGAAHNLQAAPSFNFVYPPCGGECI